MQPSRTRSWGLLGVSLALCVAAAAVYFYGGNAFGPHTSNHAHASTSEEKADAHSDATEAKEGDESTIEYAPDRWAAAGIEVQSVAAAPFAELIELTGKIALNEDKLSHVFPLVEGRADQVKVRFGQRVKQGETLVVVKSREIGQAMLQLAQDRLKLQMAETNDRWTQDVATNTRRMIELMGKEASIDEIEKGLKDCPMGNYREKLMTAYIGYRKARATMDRLTPLSEKGVVPSRQMLEAEAELDATRASLQSLLEQISQDALQASRLSSQGVKELQTTISVSETNLKILGFNEQELATVDPEKDGERLAHYPIVAPFDGTVISKDVVLLERVSPDTQILTIADLSTVWVTADIYETHLPLLSQLSRQTIHLRSDAWPGKRFEATIFYTGDVVQEATRTIALRAVAANEEGLLKPGMFVTIELPSLNTSDVLQTPAEAIQEHEGRSFVFVQTGEGKFERRDVVVGRRRPDAVEIRSGLAAGDKIAVHGGFALKSAMLASLLEE